MTDLPALTRALARPDDQPATTFGALAALAEELVGLRLFTLTIFDQASGEAERIYSSMPEAYPVSGTKTIDPGRWTNCVIDRHQTFVANDIEDIAEVFPDHGLIRSLGCGSVINVPVVVGGMLLGTVNCLDAGGRYTPERVAASDELKLPGAACFLFNAMYTHQGDG